MILFVFTGILALFLRLGMAAALVSPRLEGFDPRHH